MSHEALLTAWPQLRTWLDTDRAGLITSRQLGDAAAAWHREHRDPAALYRGRRLAVAQDWVQTAGSRVALQLVAVLAVFLLVAGGATVLAVQAQKTATQQRNVALSQRVAGEAMALRAANPALAAQLSLAAFHLVPTASARGSLVSTFATPYATSLTGHTGSVYTAVFSPDGRTLATAGFDHTARLWDVTDPHHPSVLATLTGHTDAVGAVAFSPDGHTLATASLDHTTLLWDTNIEHIASQICAISYPAITRSEWDHYLPGLTYHSPCP